MGFVQDLFLLWTDFAYERRGFQGLGIISAYWGRVQITSRSYQHRPAQYEHPTLSMILGYFCFYHLYERIDDYEP